MSINVTVGIVIDIVIMYLYYRAFLSASNVSASREQGQGEG